MPRAQFNSSNLVFDFKNIKPNSNVSLFSAIKTLWAINLISWLFFKVFVYYLILCLLSQSIKAKVYQTIYCTFQIKKNVDINLIFFFNHWKQTCQIQKTRTVEHISVGC